METQKTQNSQNSREKGTELEESHSLPLDYTHYKGYDNQKSMELAQKQTHRSMEQCIVQK